jgi:hypothetical protein
MAVVLSLGYISLTGAIRILDEETSSFSLYLFLRSETEESWNLR